MNLTQKEQELLIKILAFYYENHIYKVAITDNAAASEEDATIRSITRKLGIKEMFPNHIKQGF